MIEEYPTRDAQAPSRNVKPNAVTDYKDIVVFSFLANRGANQSKEMFQLAT